MLNTDCTTCPILHCITFYKTTIQYRNTLIHVTISKSDCRTTTQCFIIKELAFIETYSAVFTCKSHSIASLVINITIKTAIIHFNIAATSHPKSTLGIIIGICRICFRKLQSSQNNFLFIGAFITSNYKYLFQIALIHLVILICIARKNCRSI